SNETPRHLCPAGTPPSSAMDLFLARRCHRIDSAARTWHQRCSVTPASSDPSVRARNGRQSRPRESGRPSRRSPCRRRAKRRAAAYRRIARQPWPTLRGAGTTIAAPTWTTSPAMLTKTRSRHCAQLLTRVIPVWRPDAPDRAIVELRVDQARPVHRQWPQGAAVFYDREAFPRLATLDRPAFYLSLPDAPLLPDEADMVQ